MDTATLAVIITGIVTIIGAIVAGTKSIIVSLRENKQEVVDKVVDIEDQNKRQSVKLDNITILVDGRYGDVLKELAAVQQMLANSSGLPADQDRADVAQTTAAAQAKRVTDLKSRENT